MPLHAPLLQWLLSSPVTLLLRLLNGRKSWNFNVNVLLTANLVIFSEYGICLFSYLTFIKAIVIKNLIQTMSRYIKWLFYKDHVDSFSEVS